MGFRQTATWIKRRRYGLLSVALCMLFVGLYAHPVFADSAGNAISGSLGNLVYGVCATFGGMVLSLGGLFLDNAVKLLVVGMGDQVTGGIGQTIGIGSAVTMFWTMIRDLLNILFIFGLIYVGIRTILFSEDSGTRRLLGTIIAAALLINFSLYITEAFIDFTNILATQVYSQMINGNSVGTGIGGSYANQYIQTGSGSISGAFMQEAHISSWFSTDMSNILTGTNIFVFAILMMFFLMIAGIFFFLGAILLISRFVALIIYMIFSPVMFLGWIMPSMRDVSTRWWKGFVKQAFFAPLYLFMLYLSLYTMGLMLQSYSSSGGSASYTNLFDGGQMKGGTIGLFIYFVVMLGFLYGSVKVGQMMSVAGADGFTKGAKGAAHGVGGFFASAAAGRTSGRLLNMFNKAEELWDKPIPLSREIRGTLDKGKTHKFGGATSFKDRTEYAGKRKKDISTARRKTKTRNTIMNNADATAGSSERIALEQAINKADKEQILDIAKSESGRKKLLLASGDLSHEQVKALRDSGTVPDEFKQELSTSRQQAIVDKLGVTTTAPQNISKASKDQLQMIGYGTIRQNAKYLQDAQLDELKTLVKDGTLSQTELDTIKQKREADIIADGNDSPAKVLDIINSRKSEKEIAKLPKEFLENPNFVIGANLQNSKYTISSSLLTKIANESDGVNKKKIGDNIRHAHGAALPEGVRQFFKSSLGTMFN